MRDDLYDYFLAEFCLEPLEDAEKSTNECASVDGHAAVAAVDDSVLDAAENVGLIVCSKLGLRQVHSLRCEKSLIDAVCARPATQYVGGTVSRYRASGSLR